MMKIHLQTSDFLFYYDECMLYYKPVFSFYTEESITIEFEKKCYLTEETVKPQAFKIT